MKKTVCAAMGIAVALGFAPVAGADPSVGHYTIVRTHTPAMTCVIGSDDDSPDVGPNVVCQGDGFPGSTIDPNSGMHLHQAITTAAGKLTYRDANIPEGGDDFDPPTLAEGQTYHLHGWTMMPTGEGISFTNDATSHGMLIDGQRGVTAF